MTEKRYEYCRGKYRHYIQDIEKDGVWREGYIGTYGEFDLDKITVLLNELNDKNEQLKKDCSILVQSNQEYRKENKQLKKALLFFVDVANAECSSNWRKDMENSCQRLFNCSYEEAKEKYNDYDDTWWELGL